MKIDRPVFIVGCGRSGTTLLFDLLSQNPAFARTTGYPDGEDHDGWIIHGNCAMAGIGNAHSSRYGNGINGHHFCLHMTEDDVSPATIASMRHYYWSKVLKERANKRALNKQPHLSNKLRYLLSIFPDAKVVHIVRDCRPVVASWMAVMSEHPSLVAHLPEEDHPCIWLFPKPDSSSTLARDRRFFPGGGDRLWVDYWIKTNLGVESQLSAHLGQVCTVRYEDLVARPTRVLQLLSEFCEVPSWAYDVSGIGTDTAHKHAMLISARLGGEIDRDARHARAHFGYEPRAFWRAGSRTLILP